MSEGPNPEVKDAIFAKSTTRRSVLLAGLAAVAAFMLGREITKPNSFQEQAKALWEEYEKDPQLFNQKYPGYIRENLIAGPDGVIIRTMPAAHRDIGKAGRFMPNEEIGTAMIWPQKPINPADGPFLSIGMAGHIFFISEKNTRNKDQANITVSSPSNP